MRALRRDWTRLGPVVAMRDVLTMEQARLLLKRMWDDALIGLLHVTPKPHLWLILDLRWAQESFIPPA